MILLHKVLCKNFARFFCGTQKSEQKSILIYYFLKRNGKTYNNLNPFLLFDITYLFSVFVYLTKFIRKQTNV